MSWEIIYWSSPNPFVLFFPYNSLFFCTLHLRFLHSSHTCVPIFFHLFRLFHYSFLDAKPFSTLSVSRTCIHVQKTVFHNLRTCKHIPRELFIVWHYVVGGEIRCCSDSTASEKERDDFFSLEGLKTSDKISRESNRRTVF